MVHTWIGVRIGVLWLIGLNLRLSLLALPPVVPLIHRDLGLGQTSVAALMGLPLLLFAVGAVPGALLAGRVGSRRALLIGLVLIGVCAALRGLGPSVEVLFAATIGLGTAIAITQPVVPALAEHWFPTDVTRATSIWSSGLLMGTILSASLSLPVVLPLLGGSWTWSLVVWALPALLAAVLLRPALGADRPWRGYAVGASGCRTSARQASGVSVCCRRLARWASSAPVRSSPITCMQLADRT